MRSCRIRLLIYRGKLLTPDNFLLKRNFACILRTCRCKAATYHALVDVFAMKSIEQRLYCRLDYIIYYPLIDVISKEIAL
jgi:hypothetical protein